MICYLNKAEKDIWLPQLFDLFYENMRHIAPFQKNYDAEKEAWLREVSSALDKAPRQVILYLDGEELAGYVQYYIRDDLLMVEELQLKTAYQATLAYCGLCRFLLKQVPQAVQRVEAYAHVPNRRSMDLMERLGMKQLAQMDEFVHMGGDAAIMRQKFQGKGEKRL